MKNRIMNLSIFLMKDYIQKFDDCLKMPETLISSSIKDSYGIDGKIYYCHPKKRTPTWISYLKELSQEDIELSENTSNKAIILIRAEDRIMAVVFGYGRSFIKESSIERNFGLRVAMNIINPNRMRSVNASQIEDLVVNTQRQASYSTTQDEFGLNITSDIMKGITGEPYDPIFGKRVSGKDSLCIAVDMNLAELKSKLELYYNAYTDDRYKEIGFEWVDNVSEIRDSVLTEQLDEELFDLLREGDISQIHIAPPDVINWETTTGFLCSGIGDKKDDYDNYTPDPDITRYIEYIRRYPNVNLRNKLHSDKLYAMNAVEEIYPVCNIYNSLVLQIEFETETYLLSAGKWYHVEKLYYERVNNFVNNIPVSELKLPVCPRNMNEGDYNEMAADSNADYCIMDKQMTSVERGQKKIEACDLFTRNNQFIHVKNRGQSSQLSHLFAQGLVSAECFMDDKYFRQQVSERLEEKFGSPSFDFNIKPNSNQFEVVYAIIAPSKKGNTQALPFFSKVNLMNTVNSLERMHYRYSLCFIEKEE